MATATYTPRMKKTYKESVIPALQKKFNYSSPMQVPKLEKNLPEPGCWRRCV